MIVAVYIVVAIVLVSIGLAIVEYRKIEPLVFECRRCGAEFVQPPHHAYPRACPACRTANWAV